MSRLDHTITSSNYDVRALSCATSPCPRRCISTKADKNSHSKYRRIPPHASDAHCLASESHYILGQIFKYHYYHTLKPCTGCPPRLQSKRACYTPPSARCSTRPTPDPQAQFSPSLFSSRRRSPQARPMTTLSWPRRRRSRRPHQ